MREERKRDRDHIYRVAEEIAPKSDMTTREAQIDKRRQVAMRMHIPKDDGLDMCEEVDKRTLFLWLYIVSLFGNNDLIFHNLTHTYVHTYTY